MVLEIPFGSFSPREPISPLPPWFPISDHISCIFSGSWSKNLLCVYACQEFQNLLEIKYCNHVKLYTDGSLISDQEGTRSAIYIDEISTSFSWELNGKHSVAAAQLYGIYQALLFGRKNLHPHPVAIFTDSLTSLLLISTHYPLSYQRLVFAIHHLILSYSKSNHKVHLQWIPSHVGIHGNTCADAAAKAAHNNLTTIDYPLETIDANTEIVKKSVVYWKSTRRAELNTPIWVI